MSWFDTRLLEVVVLLGGGVTLGFWLLRWKQKSQQTALSVKEATLLEQARREAETIVREARVTSNEEALKIREQAEKAFTARRRELTDWDDRLTKREGLVSLQSENLAQREDELREQQGQVAEAKTVLAARHGELDRLLEVRKQELEKAAHLTESEARSLLLKQIEQELQRDAADLTRNILESAKTKAEDQARQIIALAIQRYAGNHTFETTTATVALKGDDIKGRIIGREGRNIRAFEALTGITVLIDDTPNAVVLSGFDPVRREIAREAMHRLIQDGRIHPTRIEEVIGQVAREMDDAIIRAGEEAVFKVGLPPLHAEITKVLGSLRFRQSFSQNLLDHSVEVAHLTGLLAAELGLDVGPAKRAGLLHDLGKGLNHEFEGSHAMIGADFIRRYGESEYVVNGVASHHGEVPHLNPLGILVSAADAISASRPGARSETMAIYVKRLENLETIGQSFDGVEKCFAIQAGRELRVIVQPEKISDDQAALLTRSIARRIEDELQYPGQIRVTVVRETRCIEFAK